MQKNIILFELNEIPFRIFEYFSDLHPTSTFARYLPFCKQYETYTEDVGELHPWSTWPSLHRGVNNEIHLINDYGEDLSERNLAYPPIWEILEKHSISYGIAGSLHSYPIPFNRKHCKFHLPDLFAFGHETVPKYLEPFQKYNLQMSRDSGRIVSTGINIRELLPTLKTFPKIGIQARTIFDIINQLVNERFDKTKLNRRRTYQSVLAFDVFIRQLEINKPAYSSFFTNHMASAMHRYWAATFPEDFDDLALSKDWIKSYNHEIDFAMKKSDHMFERLIDFTKKNKDYEIWLTGSMGQEAQLATPVETQLYINDMYSFMNFLGLEEHEWSERPSMLPQFNIYIETSAVKTFCDSLSKLRIDGESIKYRVKEI